MTQTITCARCQKTSDRMSEAPLPAPLGDELLAHSCENCFQDWMATEIMIINEYKLDLGVPRNQDMLNQEMARFLSLPSAAGATGTGMPVQNTPQAAAPEKQHGHGHDHGKGGGSCC